MKFETVTLFRNIFLCFSIILIGYKCTVSYNDYKTYKHHKVEVYDRTRTEKNPSNTKLISNGEIKSRLQSTYVIKAKSYWQYLVLDFNPDENTFLPFSFLFNYLVISSITFYALRASSSKRIFTEELLDGLSYLKFYVLIMMVAKPIPDIFFRNYIGEISNHTVLYVSKVNFSISYMFYYLGVILLIGMLRKALKLQEEQDLTV